MASENQDWLRRFLQAGIYPGAAHPGNDASEPPGYPDPHLGIPSPFQALMTMTDNNPSRFFGEYSQDGNLVSPEEVAATLQRDRLNHVAAQQMSQSLPRPFSQSTTQSNNQHPPYSAHASHRAPSSEQAHQPVSQSQSNHPRPPYSTHASHTAPSSGQAHPLLSSTAQPTYTHSPYSAQEDHTIQSSQQAYPPVTQSTYSPVRQQPPKPAYQTYRQSQSPPKRTYPQPTQSITQPAHPSPPQFSRSALPPVTRPATQRMDSPDHQQTQPAASQASPGLQPAPSFTRPGPQRVDSPGHKQTQQSFQQIRHTAPSSVSPPLQSAPSFPRPQPQRVESPSGQQTRPTPSLASPGRQSAPSISRPPSQGTHSPVHQQPQPISHTHPSAPQRSHQSQQFSLLRQFIHQPSHPQPSWSARDTTSTAGPSASPQPMHSPVRQPSHQQGHQPQPAQGPAHSAPASSPVQSAPSFNQPVSQRVHSPAHRPAPAAGIQPGHLQNHEPHSTQSAHHWAPEPTPQPVHQQYHQPHLTQPAHHPAPGPSPQPLHQQIHQPQPAKPADQGYQIHQPSQGPSDTSPRAHEPATIGPELLQKVPMPKPAPISRVPRPPKQETQQETQQNKHKRQDQQGQQGPSGHLKHSAKKRRLENGTSETGRPPLKRKFGNNQDFKAWSWSEYKAPSYAPHKSSLWFLADMADPLDDAEAAEKIIYDTSTIARDVLIATGRHPTELGLNCHLGNLRSNFDSVTMASDLETFRWDVVEAHARAQPPAPKTHTVKPQTHKPPPPQPQPQMHHSPQPPQTQPPSSLPAPPATHSLSGPLPQTLPRQNPPVGPPRHSPAVNPIQTPAAQPSTQLPAVNPPQQPQQPQQPRAVDLVEESPASLLNQFANASEQALGVELPNQSPTVSPPKQSPVINLPKQTPAIDLPKKRGRGRPRLQVEVPAPPEESRMAGKRSLRGPARPKVEVRVPYPVFACKWKNCQAELHNLEVLKQHMLKMHIPFHLKCEWAKCASEKTLAAADLFDHVKAQHINPIAWKLGDGPLVPAAEDSKTSASPGPIAQPDPSQAGGQDSLIFPASHSSIRAFNRVHKKNSPREKANEVLKAVQRLKERIGVGLDPGGCELATPARNQRVSNDEQVYEVVGAN